MTLKAKESGQEFHWGDERRPAFTFYYYHGLMKVASVPPLCLGGIEVDLGVSKFIISLVTEPLGNIG